MRRSTMSWWTYIHLGCAFWRWWHSSILTVSAPMPPKFTRKSQRWELMLQFRAIKYVLTRKVLTMILTLNLPVSTIIPIWALNTSFETECALHWRFTSIMLLSSVSSCYLGCLKMSLHGICVSFPWNLTCNCFEIRTGKEASCTWQGEGSGCPGICWEMFSNCFEEVACKRVAYGPISSMWRGPWDIRIHFMHVIVKVPARRYGRIRHCAHRRADA